MPENDRFPAWRPDRVVYSSNSHSMEPSSLSPFLPFSLSPLFSLSPCSNPFSFTIFPHVLVSIEIIGTNPLKQPGEPGYVPGMETCCPSDHYGLFCRFRLL